MKTIFHLDLDAFFVSVERTLDPSLNNKPVIVGADPTGRGVVSACSYEARKYGVHSGMPIRAAFKACPGGTYLHGHFNEYVHYSQGVKDILLQYAPLLEQCSIDEFCMDFTGCEKIYGNYLSFASKIQKDIYNKLSLPCSIGIGTNKTIAKIASDCLKPKGITYVLPGTEKYFLAPMPVEVIPGVGKVTLQALNNRGFYLIRDIQNFTKDYFYFAFGKTGMDLWNKAHGIGNDILNVNYEQKSISKEHTFEIDVTSKDEIKNVLFYLTGKISQSLRDEQLKAATISIKLRYSDFKTITRSKTVKPVEDDRDIFNVSWDLLSKAITRRVAIRLIGVGLSNFTRSGEEGFLFDDILVKREKMLTAINRIRAKFGFSAIQIGN